MTTRYSQADEVAMSAAQASTRADLLRFWFGIGCPSFWGPAAQIAFMCAILLLKLQLRVISVLGASAVVALGVSLFT